jgi:hypothetical protein
VCWHSFTYKLNILVVRRVEESMHRPNFDSRCFSRLKSLGSLAEDDAKDSLFSYELFLVAPVIV